MLYGLLFWKAYQIATAKEYLTELFIIFYHQTAKRMRGIGGTWV